MNKNEIRLQKKLTALNQIIKIYSKGYKFDYDPWSETLVEQRDYEVCEIIDKLKKELDL